MRKVLYISLRQLPPRLVRVLLVKEPHEVLLENDVGHPILSNGVLTRVRKVLTSMLKIQNNDNNVSAMDSQNNPKFIGDMISAK